MIQRVLYAALVYGLAAIKKDPTLLDDLFGKLYGLSDKEVSGIKTWFASVDWLSTDPNNRHVCHGYPNREANAPMYSIVLAGEEQTEKYLADAAYMVMQDDSDATEPNGLSNVGCDRQGAIWQHNYQVLCYAEHNPDLPQYMYEIAKSIYQTADRYFLKEGILEWNFGGMDLMPDQSYIPEHMFCRAMSISAQREFVSIDRNSRLGKAFQVTGMALPAGSPNDNGGALTLLSTYTDPMGQTDEGSDGQ